MTTQSSLVELAAEVGAILAKRSDMLVTAESCTGGWVSMLMTAIAGSSAWFDRGFVTYSNAAKQDMLAVSTTTLEIHGAVSEETAREMVLGAVQRSQADIGVAITGIAGPSGGSADKPVGTVCFAWWVDGRCSSATCHFSGDREAIRAASAAMALQGILDRAGD